MLILLLLLLHLNLSIRDIHYTSPNSVNRLIYDLDPVTHFEKDSGDHGEPIEFPGKRGRAFYLPNVMRPPTFPKDLSIKSRQDLYTNDNLENAKYVAPEDKLSSYPLSAPEDSVTNVEDLSAAYDRIPQDARKWMTQTNELTKCKSPEVEFRSQCSVVCDVSSLMMNKALYGTSNPPKNLPLTQVRTNYYLDVGNVKVHNFTIVDYLASTDQIVVNFWDDFTQPTHPLLLRYYKLQRRLLKDSKAHGKSCLIKSGTGSAPGSYQLYMSLVSRNLSPEEQLEDLHRRYILLDAERKAAAESAQQTIRSHSSIIKTLKEENRDMRKTSSELRDEPPMPTPSEQVGQKHSEINLFKSKLDDMVHYNRKNSKVLSKLMNDYEELHHVSQPPELKSSDQMKKIQVIENRLDKTLIKYNEALSIRKTYEQIVRRLEQERVGYEVQINQVEEAIRQKENDYDELLLLSHDAYHAKEMAHASLHRFEQSVIDERNLRDREVQEKKSLVQQRVAMNQRLEMREKALKQKGDVDSAADLALKTTAAMADLAAGMSHTEAEEEKARLSDYQEAIARIKNATGVSDVNGVISKFLIQEDTLRGLKRSAEENNAVINELKSQLDQLENDLNEAQFTNNGSSAIAIESNESDEPVDTSASELKKIDEAEARLTESESKLQRARMKYEHSNEILIQLKSGISNIQDILSVIPVDLANLSTSDQGQEEQEGDSVWRGLGKKSKPGKQQVAKLIEVCDDSIEEILSVIEIKIANLLQLSGIDVNFFKSRHESKDILYDVKDEDFEEYEEQSLDNSALPMFRLGVENIRIGPGSGGGGVPPVLMDDGDEQEEQLETPAGDFDDEILNRKQIKTNSDQVVEKAEKKKAMLKK